MAYLGSTPTTQSFIAGTDTFSGTGAQVAFTLTRAVNSVNDILVVVNNVDQQPSAYSVSGTTLTFTAAPSSGTNNVYVRYLSTTLQSITVPGGTTVDGTFGVSSSSSSDALRVTNTGTGNSFVVEDGDNPDSTPYVIDSVGTTITGYTTAIDSVSPHNGTAGFTPKVQNHSAFQATAANMIGFWNAFPTQGGAFQFVRSRSSTIGAFSPVVNNDVLGFLQFLGDDGTAFVRAADVTAAVDGTPSTGVMPGRLVFRTTPSGSSTPTEQMRIDSSGRVLIGQTASTGNDARLQVTATGSNGAQFIVTNASYPIVASNNGSGSGLVYFNYNAGNVGTITTNGSSTAYNTTSDYRLKDTITPMIGALAKVAALKPCTYKWKVNGSDGQGFIAHELQAVVPDCVTGEKDAVDAEGNPQYQGVDTSFLVATLTAAIQEQQAMIETLQAKVAALETAA